jgi:cytochrome P450
MSGIEVPTWEELETKFPYLDSVLSEVLRLYPIAPILSRRSGTNGTTVGNFVVPQDVCKIEFQF